MTAPSRGQLSRSASTLPCGSGRRPSFRSALPWGEAIRGVSAARFPLPVRARQIPTRTTTSADSCPIILPVSRQNAPRLRGTPVGQVSPDKNVSCPCTTAAFTFPSCQSGFAMLCWVALGSRLVCGFCSSARRSCLRLPSHGRSPFRSCLWLTVR